MHYGVIVIVTDTFSNNNDTVKQMFLTNWLFFHRQSISALSLMLLGISLVCVSFIYYQAGSNTHVLLLMLGIVIFLVSFGLLISTSPMSYSDTL